jgi:hypothetical protein
MQTTKAINGSEGHLLVSLDSSTFYPIKELVTADFRDSGNPVAANSHGFPTRVQRVQGRSDGSLTINCNFLPPGEDPGADLLRQAYRNKTKNVYFRALFERRVGAQSFHLTGFVNDVSWGMPDAAVEPLNFTCPINAVNDQQQVTQADIDSLGPIAEAA